MKGRTITDGVVTLSPITLETVLQFPKWLDDPDTARFLGMYHSIPDQKQEAEWYEKVVKDDHRCVWEIRFKDEAVGISSIDSIDWVNRWGVTGTVIGIPTARGQGVGTRSMILRARFAFEVLNLRALETHVFVANEPSWKAMDKCGYEDAGVLKLRYDREKQLWDVKVRVLYRKHFYELHP